jgi:hypothetical protein
MVGMGRTLAIAWQLGSIATFVFLTFFDGYRYTWWNWPFTLAANVILSELWPLYWIALRWIF